MTDLTPLDRSRSDLGRHSRAGFILVAALVLVIFGWGMAARIAGAVVAPGQVDVEGNIKNVQHLEGGIVEQILVKEGDTVSAGELLIRLSSEVSRSGVDSANSQLAELSARRLRLLAERDRRLTVDMPADRSPALAAALRGEQKLLLLRAADQRDRAAQLRQQVRQAEEQVRGTEAQRKAVTEQIELMKGELEGVRSLYKDGLAALSYLNNLERANKQLSAEQERLAAEIAAIRSHIAEIELQRMNLDGSFMASVLTELKETELRLGQAQTTEVSTSDLQHRSEIRAPAAGKVQQLTVHTVGGVIGAGQSLMTIVPQGGVLEVRAKVDPQHVAQVQAGQPVAIRLTSFPANNTPEISGRVTNVSPDVQVDATTGQRSFIVMCELTESLPPHLKGRLVPGMPAEVHIMTSNRMALSYFIKPVLDQMKRSFTEE